MRWIAALAICLVAVGSARAQDWGPTRDPFDPTVVHRYKAILAQDPHSDGAFRQLLALYKQYRTVDKLEQEYRTQLGTAEDWATLVVLARLPRPAHADSLALWKRVVAARPDDALGWLALGEAAMPDTNAARDAYRHAAQLATTPGPKRAALTKLLAAARIAGDHATVDAAYGELIALSPNDGGLWVDRGDAQLDAKHYADAKASFVAADPLLRTDPSRQLTARMKLGLALEGLGQPDDAIAQYEHTLDAVPKDYYLGAELVDRIIDVDRKRKHLGAAIARLDKRWPEARRGYFEWATLGDLYKEVGDPDRAIDAYKRAVAKAPTEVVTQSKLIALLDQRRPAEALAQHEAAARVAPGDADLQLALAKRYHAAEPAKAFATLDALGRTLARNVNVHLAMAALYEEWNERDRALHEYETLAAIDPLEPQHALALGDAYWRAEKRDKALAAWKRLDKINTGPALLQYGDVLATHQFKDEAIAAYTKSLALDSTAADAWYGRARVLDTAGRAAEAIEDARHAVALAGDASFDRGLRYRQLLVRLLGHEYTNGDHSHLPKDLARWRFAFERGDAAAGYLLAAHHDRLDTPQGHDVLVALHHRVPDDDSLTIELVRSYVHRREFTRARRELQDLAHRKPKRVDDVRKLLVQVDEDQARSEVELRWDEEGHPGRRSSPDLVAREHRFGALLLLGRDVHKASGALFGLGAYHVWNLRDGTAAIAQFDWSQRDDRTEEINLVGFAGGLLQRVFDAHKFEVALGVGPRLELRVPSTDDSAFERASLAGDVSLVLLPRALPATINVRFDRSFTDKARDAALLLELGVEFR